MARWVGRGTELEAGCRRTEAELCAVLEQRGARTDSDSASAVEAYISACRERRAVAALAARRPDLEELLRSREAEEHAARDAERSCLHAAERLHLAAGRCGIAELDEAVILERLRDWQEGRRLAADGRARALREWAELEALRAGRSLGDLAAQAGRQRERALALGAGFSTADLAAVELEEDTDAQVARVRAEYERRRRDADALRGNVEERARQLPSVPEAEEGLAAAEAELARVRTLDAILRKTIDFLERAQERVHRDVAVLLADTVRPWLPTITGGRYRDVRVDPGTLAVTVLGPDGEWRNATGLSHGTAEQIYLLLRAALARHLTDPREVCPLLLDEVTAQSDAERTRAILDLLHELSQERQIVLFSQEEEVRAWAVERLATGRDALVLLDRGVATTDGSGNV